MPKKPPLIGEPQDRSPDYRVGYGRPPKNSQFKPGQSGNPKGRPKGSKNLNAVLDKVLSQKLLIREGEKRRTVSTLEAVVLKHVSKALQGDGRAMHSILQLIRQADNRDNDELARIRAKKARSAAIWERVARKLSDEDLEAVTRASAMALEELKNEESDR
jgi:hypothetical protein